MDSVVPEPDIVSTPQTIETSGKVFTFHNLIKLPEKTLVLNTRQSGKNKI